MTEPEKPKRIRTGRVKTEAERERNKEYQKEKYAANRDDYKKARKERYDTNPEYKRKAKVRAKARYWFVERPNEPPSAKVPDIAFEEVPPKGIMPVVVDGVAHEVPVYTTAALPLILGRSMPTLLVWFKTGVLPEPHQRKNPPGMKLAKGASPRLITEDELRVIYDNRDKLAIPEPGRVYGTFTDAVTTGFAAGRVSEALGAHSGRTCRATRRVVSAGQ